jgi:hypothetical protein
MWSTDHIENYISFTNPPEFRINPDYPYEDDLAKMVLMSQISEEDYNKAITQLKKVEKTISEFRQAYAQKTN